MNRFWRLYGTILLSANPLHDTGRCPEADEAYGGLGSMLLKVGAQPGILPRYADLFEEGAFRSCSYGKQ